MRRADLRSALRTRRRELNARLQARRAALQAALRSRRMPQRSRRRRRWWWLGLLLLLLLLRKCDCGEAPLPPASLAPTHLPPPITAPPPPPEPPRGRLKRRPRPRYRTPAVRGPSWLDGFRLQVASRSPRLARCFEGTDQPGVVRWSATVEPKQGRVRGHTFESSGTALALTAEQRKCLIEALSTPNYRLEAGLVPEDPVRVRMVLEF